MMSQSSDLTANVDELRNLNLSDDEEGHGDNQQDESQGDTQQDAEQDSQQENDEDNQQARQENHEEHDQEQDQQRNDQNSPRSKNDLAQVSANTEGSIRVTTQDSTCEPQQQDTAGASSNQQKDYRAECEDIIRALRRPTPDELQSPLLTLKQQIEDFFQHGPERATGIFLSMLAAAECGLTKASFPDGDVELLWKSCKASATLVGLLACPPDRLNEVFEFLHYTSDHLDLTIEDIEDTPSESLKMAFPNAKALALGEKGLSTAIMVSVADICHFRLAALEKDGDYTSFAHAFVLGIGPEGVVTWQSWAEHGYSLDQWIDGGGTQVGTWKQASDFVKAFEKFAAYKGEWHDECNKLYEKLFDVNIIEICGPTGPSKPIVPEVDPWVRLLVMEDVKLDDLHKFTFE